MIRLVLLALLLVFSVRTAEAKFSPLSLSALVGGADLIVTGTIAEVYDETFIMNLNSLVVGELQQQRIEVQKFKDWACGRRWAKYERGQQVILFLTEYISTGWRVWRIMGAGGEGEMGIEGTDVYPRVPVSAAWSHKRNEAYYGPRIQKVAIETLLDAVRGYRKCFKLTTQSGWCGPSGVRQVCNEERLTQFRNRSELHGFIAEQTLATSKRLLERWKRD